MTREIIEIRDEQHWLEMRAQDITSTAVSALFDLSPYMTAFEVYHAHKTGVRLPFEENSRTLKGKRMEHYAALEVAESLKATDVRPLNVYARIPNERFGSSFDYELELTGGEKILLELKAVDYFRHKDQWRDGEAPPHIEIQVQHQMEAVDRYDNAIIAAFTGIYDFKQYDRPRDREMGRALREATRKFWRDVEHGNEPAPDYYRDAEVLAELYRNAGGDAIDATADTELDRMISEYRRLKSESDVFDKEARALKARIHHHLGEHGGAFTENFKLVCGWAKGSPGKLITPEMVGSRIGERDGYRQLLTYDLTAKKSEAA